MILISKIFGWISFVVWSISFYPQVYTNYVKKSAEGITLDMNIYYILGYIFYSTYLFTMYFNSKISNKYEQIFNVSTTEIDLSDIFFVTHSSILSIVLTVQYFIYRKPNTKPLDCINKGIILFISYSMLLYLVISYVFIMCISSDLSTIVYYIYTCGMVNNIISCIKYLPQIVYHYKNKSIGEWNLWNTHTDIAGGIFLIAQITADAISANDSSIIYSNLTKLNLSLITIIFDIIIYIQYYKYNKKDRINISELQSALI